VITGNQIVNNPGSGLAFINGGVGSKVESNVITNNGVGVEYDVAGGDLGGGSVAVRAGNVISCNVNDLRWWQKRQSRFLPRTISGTTRPHGRVQRGRRYLRFQHRLRRTLRARDDQHANAALTTTTTPCPS